MVDIRKISISSHSRNILPPELVSTPKALTGRNLTLLTRKRQREIPTKKYWWKQPEVSEEKTIKKILIN